MNWLINILQKEARGRRFRQHDRVRYFTAPRSGKGKVVLTPNFGRGRVVDWNGENRRYVVHTDGEEQIEVHPRNIMPETFGRDAEPAVETEAPDAIEV